MTGGNRGLGLAIAQRFMRSGIEVVIGARDRAAGEMAAATLAGGPVPVSTLVLDVTSDLGVRAAVRELDGRDLAVDILVNNAGVLDDCPLLSLPDAQFARAFAVHVFGPHQLIRCLAPGMIARGYGRIVNVSSEWGAFSAGLDGPGAYGVSKAALNALTVRYARELPTCVKINAMCPGWVRTRMGGPDAPVTPAQAADTAHWLATLPDDGPSGGFFRDREPVGW